MEEKTNGESLCQGREQTDLKMTYLVGERPLSGEAGARLELVHCGKTIGQ